MMKSITVLLCATIISAYGVSAEQNEVSGFYLGGGLGWSYLNPQVEEGAPYVIADKNGLAFHGYGGYLFNPKWSLELGFATLGTTGIAEEDDSDNIITEVSYYATNAAMLYRLWDYDHAYNVFAKAELSTFATDTSGEDIPIHNDDTVLLGFGIGATYRLSRHFNLRADFDNYSTDAKSVYVGIEWKPGARPKPADSDNDGIIDTLDQCPNTSAGVDVDSRGCEINQDNDGDGVLDMADQCPDTPVNMEVDASGCPLDSDQDGYPGYLDQCPHSAIGAKVDDRGCEMEEDSDGDGVFDSADLCPNTVPDAQVNHLGCELDDDLDGVLNSQDQCPGTPMEAMVDASGCTLSYSQQVQQEVAVINPANIQFATDSADLTDGSKQELQTLIAIMTSYSDINVDIHAYTDNVGNEKYNLKLSQRRADNVKAYLVKMGIDADRLNAYGFGEGSPVADNNTQDGRSLNRRVEFKVITQ